jgi:hypothetical protein
MIGTTVKIKMVFNKNDTYTWLYNTVNWALKNCSSFQYHKDTLEPYVVRDPKDLHYVFNFTDQQDANWFALRWMQ